MTDPTTPTSTTSPEGDATTKPDRGAVRVSGSGASRAQGSDSSLVTAQGRTTIADSVVAKIAGIAAREVTGVHALGGGAARAVGAIRERISSVASGVGPDVTQGVSVEVGEREAAVDLVLVADYGVSIADLAEGIRRNVIAAVERMTGLDVTEVNIDVQDVYLPSDDDDDQDDRGDAARTESRVQ